MVGQAVSFLDTFWDGDGFPCSLICFYNWQLLYILYYTSCFLCTLQSLHEPKQLDNLSDFSDFFFFFFSILAQPSFQDPRTPGSVPTPRCVSRVACWPWRTPRRWRRPPGIPWRRWRFCARRRDPWWRRLGEATGDLVAKSSKNVGPAINN